MAWSEAAYLFKKSTSIYRDAWAGTALQNTLAAQSTLSSDNSAWKQDSALAIATIFGWSPPDARGLSWAGDE